MVEEEGRYLYLIGASGGGGENVCLFSVFTGVFSVTSDLA